MNTRVGRIARRQARFGGFAASPSSSLEASIDKNSNAGDDEDDDGSSSSDDELTSQ